MVQYLRHADYTVGWICAISVEFQAAISMLDEVHRGVFPQVQCGESFYEAGRIEDHNIVLACLAEQKTGNVAAAGLMKEMKMTFPKLRYCLMVGIGAGVPGPNGLEPDVRLGDIVVAFPTDKSSGIVNYELGKDTVDGFQKRLDDSYRMDLLLLNTISSIKRHYDRGGINEFLQYLSLLSNPQILGKRDRQGTVLQDRIRKMSSHPTRRGCTDTLHNATGETMIRPPRPDLEEPVVHYGPIASGDKVVKNPERREFLREKYGVLCIEMEAAGLRDSFPVAIIRGISDYADSHKNDDWHAYAAFVAAAYAKGVVCKIPPKQEDLIEKGSIGHS